MKPPWGGGVLNLDFVGGMTGPPPPSWEVACSVLTTFSFDFCLSLRFCVELSSHRARLIDTSLMGWLNLGHQCIWEKGSEQVGVGVCFKRSLYVHPSDRAAFAWPKNGENGWFEGEVFFPSPVIFTSGLETATSWKQVLTEDTYEGNFWKRLLHVSQKWKWADTERKGRALRAVSYVQTSIYIQHLTCVSLGVISVRATLLTCAFAENQGHSQRSEDGCAQYHCYHDFTFRKTKRVRM